MRMRLQIALSQSFLPNLFSFWNWTLCRKDAASSKLLLWALFGVWKEPTASAVQAPRLANEDIHLIWDRDWQPRLLNCFSPALKSVLSLSHSPFLSPMCSLFPSNSLPLFLLQNRFPLLFSCRTDSLFPVPISALGNTACHREMMWKRRNNYSHFCSMTWDLKKLFSLE